MGDGGSLPRSGGSMDRAVNGKGVCGSIKEDKGVASAAVAPPAGGDAAKANKVGKKGPETGNCKARARGNEVRGIRGRVGRANAERVHAPPAAVHG